MLHYAVLFSALDYTGCFRVMFSVGSLSIQYYTYIELDTLGYCIIMKNLKF